MPSGGIFWISRPPDRQHHVPLPMAAPRTTDLTDGNNSRAITSRARQLYYPLVTVRFTLIDRET